MPAFCRLLYHCFAVRVIVFLFVAELWCIICVYVCIYIYIYIIHVYADFYSNFEINNLANMLADIYVSISMISNTAQTLLQTLLLLSSTPKCTSANISESSVLYCINVETNTRKHVCNVFWNLLFNFSVLINNRNHFRKISTSQ